MSSLGRPKCRLSSWWMGCGVWSCGRLGVGGSFLPATSPLGVLPDP